MLLLLVFGILASIFIILAVCEIFDFEVLWTFLAAISILVFLSLIIAAVTAPRRGNSFRIEYNNHVAYLNAIEGTSITEEERITEINSINSLNRAIQENKFDKESIWISCLCMDVRNLPLLNFTDVPKATRNKNVTIEAAK